MVLMLLRVCVYCAIGRFRLLQSKNQDRDIEVSCVAQRQKLEGGAGKLRVWVGLLRGESLLLVCAGRQ
jgi:hypothetical protein